MVCLNVLRQISRTNGLLKTQVWALAIFLGYNGFDYTSQIFPDVCIGVHSTFSFWMSKIPFCYLIFRHLSNFRGCTNAYIEDCVVRFIQTKCFSCGCRWFRPHRLIKGLFLRIKTIEIYVGLKMRNKRQRVERFRTNTDERNYKGLIKNKGKSYESEFLADSLYLL